MDGKTFVVTIDKNQQKTVSQVYKFWVDTELNILYLQDGNGEIIAVFNRWLFFEVRNEQS